MLGAKLSVPISVGFSNSVRDEKRPERLQRRKERTSLQTGWKPMMTFLSSPKVKAIVKCQKSQSFLPLCKG